MNKTMRRIWSGVTTILVTGVVILVLLLVGVRAAGLQVYTVLSGSMEPAFPVGSLLYVKDVETSQLGEGDVITYYLANDLLCTHRIVEVIPDEDDSSEVLFATKGDANEYVDGSLVSCDSVVGTPVCAIPYLGYLAAFIQTIPGTCVTITGGVFLFVLILLPELLKDETKEGGIVQDAP